MQKISDKLAITFGLLIFSAILVSGWYIYGQTKYYLDQELGQRLVDIAQAIALNLNGDIIKQLAPGHESGLTYQYLTDQLNQIKEKTVVRRVYIFDQHHRSMVDTQPGIPIGTPYLKLKFDQLELESVWQKKGMASVLFVSEDGDYYKSGYAPIISNGKVIASVGVDASADFLQILKKFRRNVLTFGVFCIFISLAIVYIVSKTITNPIHKLVAAIENLGSGDFKTEIMVHTNDEIGFLGKTIEQMRLNILKRDDQMKLMLANVAHEIRNPLGGIELFAGILAEELGQSEGQANYGSYASLPVKDHLEKISQEVRKLNQIITEFLDFAKPKPPQKREVCLDELIKATYSILALEIEESKIRFEGRIDPIVKISVDQEQFKRIFLNIFKNSIQALQHNNSDNRRITVQSEQRNGLVEIIVNDNGPGIAPENLVRLFEPFFTTKEKGAGLGLSIVQKIVSDHGGNIEIHSQQSEFTRVIIRVMDQPG